jgi:hypothetical protein
MFLHGNHLRKSQPRRRAARAGRPLAAWAGNHIGFYPFPTEIADQMRDDDPTRITILKNSSD